MRHHHGGVVEDPPEGATEVPMFLSAATRRWLANGGAQGRPTSQGGPIRRRRTHRRLEELELQSKGEPSPLAAVAHVRVIDAQVTVKEKDRMGEGATPVTPVA
jgi:hypothetical protein